MISHGPQRGRRGVRLRVLRLLRSHNSDRRNLNLAPACLVGAGTRGGSAHRCCKHANHRKRLRALHKQPGRHRIRNLLSWVRVRSRERSAWDKRSSVLDSLQPELLPAEFRFVFWRCPMAESRLPQRLRCGPAPVTTRAPNVRQVGRISLGADRRR